LGPDEARTEPVTFRSILCSLSIQRVSLPLIQLRDNAGPDLLGVGPDVLFDDGDAVLGDGENDRGMVRRFAVELRVWNHLPLSRRCKVLLWTTWFRN